MKILVTGGAGFIGSAVCRYLIQATDHEVINVDCLTYAGNLASLNEIDQSDRYSLEVADIRDRTAVEHIFTRYQPDAIMHLAAETHVDRSINSAEVFVQTNIVGTFNLLEIARNYYTRLSGQQKQGFRFLHISTDEVFGSLSDTGLFNEDSHYNPSSPYSASKAASDHLATAWHRTYGLPTIITNCSNCYGPYHFPEKLIPLMILNGLEGKPLPVYGTGANIRDWLYVEDHATALHLILEKGTPGQTYNIGGRNERSNLQVVTAICDILDEVVPTDHSRKEQICFVADRPGHDLRYALDATKLETELGWRANETFETGLRKTVQWYLARKDWWQPLRARKYNGERLGLLKDAPQAE